MIYRPPIHPKRRSGGDDLGDPEGVPRPVWSHCPAQEKGGGEDDRHVPAQGNDQGLTSPAQPLQGSGGGDGHGGDEKAPADDPQGGTAGLNSGGLVGEQGHEGLRPQQAHRRAQGHDDPAGAQGGVVQLPL